MSRPFNRESAKKRADMSRNAAVCFEQSAIERDNFAKSATMDEDRVAAERCAIVARQQAAYYLRCASAYEDVARGNAPDFKGWS